MLGDYTIKNPAPLWHRRVYIVKSQPHLSFTIGKLFVVAGGWLDKEATSLTPDIYMPPHYAINIKGLMRTGHLQEQIITIGKLN